MEQYQPAYVPHDDPMIESRQNLLQGLAVLSTVGEAGARWAAVGIQNRAAERERQAHREQAARAAQEQADKLAAKVRADRQKMADAVDGDWLTGKAGFAEAAAAWRSASVHAAAGDPLGMKVAGLAEERLRKIRPDLMDAYDRYRANGVPIPEAMRAAVRDVWVTDARNYRPPGPTARPHGNTPGPAGEIGKDGPAALPAGGAILADLDAAVRAEVYRLAEHVSPEALDELQRSWRGAGKLPPDDPVELLRAHLAEAVDRGHLQPAIAESIGRDLDAHAAAERGRGTRAAGAVDDARTPVDEHTAGQVDSVRRDDSADHDAATAAAHRAGAPRPPWADAFPALSVPVVNPAVAHKKPAQAVTAAPTRGRGR